MVESRSSSNTTSPPTAYCVDIDDHLAAFDLTEKLIESGAKNIAYISFSLNTTARKRRLDGYKAALEKHHIEFSDRMVICNSMPASLHDAGRDCAGIYTARNLDADAVVLSDLLMLNGIISFCDQIKTPALQKLKTLPVATFDYQNKNGPSDIRYSVTQPIEEIGSKTVQVLMESLKESSAVPAIQIIAHDIHTLQK